MHRHKDGNRLQTYDDVIEDDALLWIEFALVPLFHGTFPGQFQ